MDHELQQSTVRRFGYDGNEILTEYDGTNQSVTTYTHSTLRTDDALALHNSSGTYYLIKDSLGSITDITNEGGFKVQHHTYSSFGKLEKVTDQNGTDISASPIVVPYLTYTGREYDKESGLYYYRARYYDPNSGRFLTEDSHPGSLSSPLSFNSKYVYTENNPINFTDPSGRLKFRHYIALAASFTVGFAGGFVAGLILGPIGGAAAGGIFGFITGGEVAYFTNRLLGGSREDSNGLRSKGRTAGAIGGVIGGIAGGVVAGNGGGFDLTDGWSNSVEAAFANPISTLSNFMTASLITEGFVYGAEKVLTEVKCKKEGDDLVYKASEGRCMKDDGKIYIPLYSGSL